MLHSKSCISLCPFHSQTSSKSFTFKKASASDHDFAAFPGAAARGDNAGVLWGAGTVPSPTPDLISTTSPLSQGMRTPVRLNNMTRYFILLQGCSDPSQNQEGKVHNLVNTHLLCVSVYTCANRGQKLMLGTFFFKPPLCLLIKRVIRNS